MKQAKLKLMKTKLYEYYAECQLWLTDHPGDEDANELIPHLHNTVAKLSNLIERKFKNKEE